MSIDRLSIAIVEPSSIVWEGLSNLLLKSQHHFAVCRFGSVDELQRFASKRQFHLVIVNPALIQNRECEFFRIRKGLPDMVWGAFVYSLFDSELLARFDFVISLTDSVESIVDKLGSFHAESVHDANSSDGLTEREAEVLVLLTKGYSNKEIADKLNISVHTVISHRKNIVEKTDIKSLPGLTIYAISKKLISLDS